MQVVLVALVVSLRQSNTRFSIPAAVLNLVAALSIAVLAHAEHVKSIRPSFLLTAYLFATLLFDAARLRTEWLMSLNTAYAGVLSASTALKLALLVLETVEKRRILITTDHVPSVESTSGPFSRGFFVWLNPLLLTGWSTALENNQLPPVHERLSSADLATRFAKQWERGEIKTRRACAALATAADNLCSYENKQTAVALLDRGPHFEMGYSWHCGSEACCSCFEHFAAVSHNEGDALAYPP